MNAPCSGQAKSSDHEIISPALCSLDLLPFGNGKFSDGAFKLSIANAPPPNRKEDSTASVSLCLALRRHTKRSILTSMSWRKFLSKVGGFSNSASWPFTLPFRKPCSTNCLNKSWCVPFLALITGDQTAIVCSSKFHKISSTIS